MERSATKAKYPIFRNETFLTIFAKIRGIRYTFQQLRFAKETTRRIKQIQTAMTPSFEMHFEERGKGDHLKYVLLGYYPQCLVKIVSV